MINKFGADEVWDCIERALTSINFKDSEYPSIVHQTITCTPQYFNKALMRFPNALHERDKDNRLPIHLALDNGMVWDYNLGTIIQANYLQLKDCDPLTKLPLLALAAREPSCDLRTIYYLLGKNPECVDSAIEKHKRKQQSQDCDDGTNKKQKSGIGRPTKKTKINSTS